MVGISRGTVTDVTNRLDIETLHEIGVRELHMNESGRVSLSHPIVCEPYEASRELGGFILVERLTRNTMGAGMVTEVRAGRSDVYWHHLSIDRHARAGLNGQLPAVLWFTGVSAPYEGPLEPDIRLRTIAAEPEVLAEQVVVELQRRGTVG